MTVSIEEVPKWLILSRAIGHIVSCTRSGWHHTLCGSLTPNGLLTSKRPALICRKCRAALKLAVLPSTERSQP